MLQNFADSWQPLDLEKIFYKPTKHFTKYDDESPLFTKAGFHSTFDFSKVGKLTLSRVEILDSSVPILITLPSKKTRIENSSQTGYEFIDKEYIRNQDDVNLRKLGKFYLQLQNKNIPYSKEKPAPTNFVPKLLSLIKMMKKTTVSERFTIFLSILVGSKSFGCLRQYFDPLSHRFKGFLGT